MKIALPTDGRMIDAHFGHCAEFTIFTLDESKAIISEDTVTPPAGCGCKTSIIPTLAEMGVTVMLAGNMGGGAAQMLVANGIEVIRGVSGDARTAVEAWLEGQVNDSGVGCSAHDHGDCTHEH